MEYNICEEYIHIIKARIKTGDYKKAIESATKVIEYSPEFAQAYYLRGICYYATNDFISSITDYGFAVSFEKDFARAYFNMGVAKYKLRRFNEAIKDMEKAKRIFKKKNDQVALRKCNESISIIKQEKI